MRGGDCLCLAGPVCLPASPPSNRACAVNETAKRRLLVCSSSAYSLGTGSADGKFAVCLHW